jgi:hypothetical protein
VRPAGPCPPPPSPSPLRSPTPTHHHQTKLEMEKAQRTREQLEQLQDGATGGAHRLKLSTPLARGLYSFVKLQYVWGVHWRWRGDRVEWMMTGQGKGATRG